MEQAGHITWEITGSTGILSLGPPPDNLLHEPEFIPLQALREWTATPGLKGIVIHGQGKHFSAGADIRSLFGLLASGEDLEARIHAGKALLDHLESLDIPLVAAVQGICFGGGLEIALACHIRIGADNALFAFPEAGHGMLPGLGGTVRAAGTIGPSAALNMILNADMINAEEALAIGLIDRVVPRKELRQSSLSLMEKMTRDRPLPVIRAIVRALRNAGQLTREEAMHEETKLFCSLAREEAERRKRGES